MKLKYWALSLLACGGMLSCSNNDDITGNGEQGEEGATSYLAVNIMNVGSNGTRSLPDDYEAGLDAENTIDKVRFYFFDADGNAYKMSNGKSYSEASYTQNSTADGTSETVEEIGNAVLVINGSTQQPPVKAVAIANPPSNLADTYTLTALKDVLVSSYVTGSNFIMSSSVYVDNESEVCEVPIVGHVEASNTAALANPVDVYIERLAAKVRLKYSGAEKTFGNASAFLVDGTDGSDDAVYAKIIGWTLISEPNNSYLIKKVSTSWTDGDLGITPWTSPDYHRSFWAQMPPSNVTFSKSFTLGNITVPTGGYDYTLENTTSTKSDLTQVLVRAQLVDKEGNAKSRYVYLGSDSYTSENDIKAAIIPSFFNSNQIYYVKTASDPADTYSELRPQDLKFVTGTSLGDNANSYRIYPQLTDEAAANLYTYNGTTYSPVSDVTSVNTALKQYPAQVWTDGACYYTTTIRHLASDNSKTAYYGVVRNHIYDITISDIVGFGTPVYDPNEEIDHPETPEDDASYLAARVNILSWKVVPYNVTLGQ